MQNHRRPAAVEGKTLRVESVRVDGEPEQLRLEAEPAAALRANVRGDGPVAVPLLVDRASVKDVRPGLVEGVVKREAELSAKPVEGQSGRRAEVVQVVSVHDIRLQRSECAR